MDSPFILPTGDSGLFCDAINNRIKKGIVEDTSLTLTIVNGRQFSQGQVVVVPRHHVSTLFDLTEEEDSAIMFAARKVGKPLLTRLVIQTECCPIKTMALFLAKRCHIFTCMLFL